MFLPILTEKLLQMPKNMVKLGQEVERWDKKEPLNVYLEEIEKEMIRSAMIEASGNISKCAEILQIKRQTLQHKLKKYEMKI